MNTGNTNTSMTAPPGREMDVQNLKVIETKILQTLAIYPKLSYSMLQTGIGPALPPSLWRPMLDDLMHRRLVKEEQMTLKSAGGRINTHKILSLTQDGIAWTQSLFAPAQRATIQSPTTHNQGRPA